VINERATGGALRAVADALGVIDRDDLERACEMIAAATGIGIYGCGREVNMGIYL